MGTPKPSAAPSITCLRSMAMAMARRTRTSSSGLRLLLMARMALPRVPAISTWNFLLPSNCLRLRAAATRGNASTSPDSSAATWAAGSLMKRIVTRRSLTSLAWRQPSQRASVTAEPLAQVFQAVGAGAHGLRGIAGHAFGLHDDGRGLAELEQQVGVAVLQLQHHGVASSGVSMRSMLAKVALSLLGPVLSAARSKLNFTAAASKARRCGSSGPGAA